MRRRVLQWSYIDYELFFFYYLIVYFIYCYICLDVCSRAYRLFDLSLGLLKNMYWWFADYRWMKEWNIALLEFVNKIYYFEIFYVLFWIGWDILDMLYESLLFYRLRCPLQLINQASMSNLSSLCLDVAKCCFQNSWVLLVEKTAKCVS